MELTKTQWKFIEPLLPDAKSGDGRRGRPAHLATEVLQGILWILRTGAPWHDLPKRYPSYQTCHRRFQKWVETGLMQKILIALWNDLRKRGLIEDVEGFIDGTYVPAKKGAISSAPAVLERRPRSWQSQTAMVFRSLSVLPLEIETKFALWNKLWMPLSLADSQGNLLETKLTTVLRLFANSPTAEELNSLLQFEECLTALRAESPTVVHSAVTNADGKSNAFSPG